MKNYQMYIIIILVLLVVGLILTNRYIDLRNNSIPSTSISPRKDYNSHIISNLMSDNVCLNLKKKMLSFDKYEYLFKDVIHPDTMYLIFRNSSQFCSSCIHEILENLNVLKNHIPCIRVLVIVSNSSFREMKVKMLPFKDQLPVYMITDNDIGLSADESELPYLTFINDGKTSKHTFILDANSSVLLLDYIQMLSQKYCK